jgi:Fur family transcriptional regulator, peroxide stress response regulator
MRKTKSQMLRALKETGFRLTQQRRAIIDFIAGREDHPSAKQIFEVLQTKTDISFATIYNTLETLVKIELIKEIDFEHKENRYDTNLRPHLNLVCTKCGSIQDVEFKLPVTPQQVKADTKFTTTNYRLEFMGVCAQCNKQ